MKKLYAFLFMACALFGCLDERPAKKAEQPIVNNLPVNDRELLLGPLEGALDDLKKNIDANDAFFASNFSWDRDGEQGKMNFKLDGADTMMLTVEIKSHGTTEHHAWYFDRDATLFFSQHRVQASAFPQRDRLVKFYYEEAGSKLSTYACESFQGDPLPEDWTPVCLTSEEEQFLNSRLAHVREMVDR